MLEKEIAKLIIPILQTLECDLFEIKISSGKIRVYIDKPGGVSIDDCVRVNRHIGDVLEAETNIAGRFALEVSSPGAERPLRCREDFEKYKNSLVKLKVRSGEPETQRVIIGNISGVSESSVEITMEDGKVEKYPFSDVLKANLRV